MSKLENDPMLVLGELPHLNTLRLFAGSYVGSEMACLDGHFPKLSVLKLWKLERLEQWTVEKGSMSQLVELEIRGCEELKDKWIRAAACPEGIDFNKHAGGFCSRF